MIKSLLDAGVSLARARQAVECLRVGPGADLAVDQPRAHRTAGSVLAQDDGELVDLLRGGQGVFNIVPLAGVVAELRDHPAPEPSARRRRGRPARRDRRVAGAREPRPAPQHRVARAPGASRTPASEVFATLLTSTAWSGATSRSSSRSPGTTAASRPARSGPTSTCRVRRPARRADRAGPAPGDPQERRRSARSARSTPRCRSSSSTSATSPRCSSATRSGSSPTSRLSIRRVSRPPPVPLRRSRRAGGQDRPLRRVGDAAGVPDRHGRRAPGVPVATRSSST